MVKARVKKIIITITMVGLCFFIPKTTVQAGSTTIKEIEPNNAISEAQLITANNEKPEGTLGDGEFVVSGTTTSADEDCFKVYLKAGENYMTCNGSTGNSYSYQVSSEAGQVISRNTYTKTAYGVTGYQFSVSTSGYYYVRILGTNTVSNSYLFSIGSPNYATSECRMTNGSITLSSAGQTRSISYNFSNNTSIPAGAIATQIVINGVRTTDVKSIQVRNEARLSTVTLDNYIWSKSKLNSMNLPIHTNWNATFTYNKQVTLTPEILIYYVYPVVGQQLP